MALNQSSTPARRMIGTWQNLLDDYEVQHVLLEAGHDHELINGMRQQAKWVIELEGKETVLFTRSAIA